MPRPDASIGAIIVNYRTPDLAIECLASLDAERRLVPNLRVILVDGGSGDESDERIAEAIAARGYGDWATLLPLKVNGGFGYANNQAIYALRDGGGLPDGICLINPDARARPGALATLRDRLFSAPRIGAVGARLEREDASIQGSAFLFPSIRSEFCRGARTDILRRLLRQPHHVIITEAARPVPWVTGAAVLFRREALEEVGLFDDGFFLYFEETELMHRLTRAGWEIWHEPAARVVHIGGQATKVQNIRAGRASSPRLPRYWYNSRRRYFVRTGGALRMIAAGIAYLAGRLFWQVRCALTGRVDDDPLRTTRDFIAYASYPRAEDRRAIVPSLSGAAGAPPAWKNAGR
ncbi:MAG TPA: glycosyltransferase family 2 protein [Sphingomonadaceae bacterium]|nr:glycosyltransferase family 2 protein [Sphingomonadaceae bacterium]